MTHNFLTRRSTNLTYIGDMAGKGPGKPVMLKSGRTLSTLSGQLVAEMEEVWVLRGAGGFGGPRGLPHDPLPPMPENVPDASLDLPTVRNQAMLYRLSGDRNPLRIDPETAKLGGFDRPILHGLATRPEEHRLNSVTNAHLVCRFPLGKKKTHFTK